MFNKGQLAGLMKQAQAMQDNLKKAQDELAFVEVEGQAGSGMVKVLWPPPLTMPCGWPKRFRSKKWASSPPVCHRA
jgi:Ni2+-binding GTPase involved in maturation of urease and hydrogenase